MKPIAVVGPTASGKSALGIALAHEFGGEVVNVDSMQLYKGMDIGTAKLPVAEREGIPHHLLDIWEVTRTASVAEYQALAVATVEKIMARGKVPVLVGGSMLYVQSLIDAWSFPPTDPSVRAKYEARLSDIGVDALHAELAEVDPAAARIIEDKDPRRTVRALEVIELTGKPFQASQPPKNAAPRWGTRILGLRTNAEWLNPRIELRTKLMFEQGLIDETRGLVDAGLVRDSTAAPASAATGCCAWCAAGEPKACGLWITATPTAPSRKCAATASERSRTCWWPRGLKTPPSSTLTPAPVSSTSG